MPDRLDELEGLLDACRRDYRRLFDGDLTGRFVAAGDWTMLEANAPFARLLLGVDDVAPLMGRSFLDFCEGQVTVQRATTLLRTRGEAGPLDVRLTTSGNPVDSTCRFIAERDDLQQVVRIHAQVVDVSDVRRAEASLAGAGRMELAGRLAGGMAHDFNNLLMVISGNAEILAEGLPDDDALLHAVGEIRQSSQRATTLVRQILAFSRQQIFQLRQVALHTVVAELQELLQEVVGSDVTLRIEVTEVPVISIDVRQITDVIIAFAINAREAMPEGGVLTLRVDPVTIGEGDAAPRWVRPGRHVRLTVRDTGIGMDAATKAHVFQPFFTTKGLGTGRGLGLAMAYGIVKQSHGFVWVESEPGEGATFTLLLPVLSAEPLVAPARATADGGEVILLVDPDESLRGLAADALRRRGYDVLEAESAESATRVFAACPTRVDLLVADARCITSNGQPMVSLLRDVDPLLQFLLMVPPTDGKARRAATLPTTPTIQKPFTLRALVEQVRQVLVSGEGRG